MITMKVVMVGPPSCCHTRSLALRSTVSSCISTTNCMRHRVDVTLACIS